jgi:Secretion system C-terminal sorting domain
MTTGHVSIDGFVAIINKAGTVKLRAYAGDDLETAGATKEITLTIHKAAQSILFEPLPTKILGSGSFNLPLTSVVGLDISYTSSNETVATVTGNVITLLGAGETTITASQEGNENYAAAESVAHVLTVETITGVEDDWKDLISVHPNPTVDYLIVKGIEHASLTLLDATGNAMLTLPVSGLEAKHLDLQSLPAGVYFLKISSAKTETFKRIVKK